MYKIDKESIEKVIADAKFVADEDGNRIIRDALYALVREMCDYTTDVNKTLLYKALTQEKDDHIGEIAVTLMPSGEEKSNEAFGFCRMVNEDPNRVFVNDEYDFIRALNGDTTGQRIYWGRYMKNGKVENFPYHLKFDRSYVELQELIYKFAEHYKVSNPIIFSPFSHKSFYLIYDSNLDKEGYELDFCFEENGIDAIQDKQLYWNIKKSVTENKTYDAKIPYGEETRYKYRFKKTKKGKYVIPLPLNNQTRIFDIQYTENGIDMTTDHDMDDFVLLEHLDVDYTASMVKALKSSKMVYSNSTGYTGIVTGRLVSKGDIEHALAPFRNLNGIKCTLSEGKEQIINRYSVKYRANRKNRVLFQIIQREYVFFSGDLNERFLNDYANYVLEYLEYFYPEIEWVGER